MKWTSRTQRAKGPRKPIDIASESFKQALTKFEVSESQKTDYIIEVSTMEKARFMNMKLLAIVYKFMGDYQIKTWEDATLKRHAFDANNTIVYTDLLIQSSEDIEKKSPDELNIYRIEIRDEMVRYMIVILSHRARHTKQRPIPNPEEEYEDDDYEVQGDDDDALGPDEEEED